MEIDNLVKVTVGAAVVIIMIVAFAIPVMSGFTESSDGTNADNSRSSPSLVGVNASTTIEIDSTGEWKFNGVASDLERPALYTEDVMFSTSGSSTIVVTDVGGSINFITSAELSFDGSRLSGTYTEYESSATENIDVSTSTVLVLARTSDFTDEWVNDDKIYCKYSSGGEFFVNSDSTLLATVGNTGALWGTYDSMELKLGISQDSYAQIDVVTTDNASLEIVSADMSDNTTLYIPQTYYTSFPTEAQVSGAAATIIDILPLIMVIGVLIAAVGIFLHVRG